MGDTVKEVMVVHINQKCCFCLFFWSNQPTVYLCARVLYTRIGIDWLRKSKSWKYSWLNSQSNSWVNAALQNLHYLHWPRNLFLSSNAVIGMPIITFDLVSAYISESVIYFKKKNQPAKISYI